MLLASAAAWRLAESLATMLLASVALRNPDLSRLLACIIAQEGRVCERLARIGEHLLIAAFAMDRGRGRLG